MIHQKDFPFHEPEDETEIIHVDHGNHRTGFIGKAFVFGIVAVMIFLSAKALFDFGRGEEISSGTPVIEANPEPYKSTPEDPGGMAIPHIDKEIYGKIKMPIEEPIDLYAEEHFKSSPLARLIEKENKEAQEENKTVIDSNISNKPEVVRPEKDSKPEAKTIRIDANGRTVESTAKTVAAPETVSKAKRIDVEKVLAKNAGGNEIWLQLGSFKSEEEATKAWQDTREKNSDILKDMTIKVTKSDMKEQGVFYRLQAGSAASESEAKDLCVKLNARKQQCFYTVNKNNNN